MFKLKSLITLGIICISQSRSFCQTKHFELIGKIDGSKLKYIILEYRSSLTKSIKDTIVLKNGKFRYKGEIDYPVLAAVYGCTESYSLNYENFSMIFIEPKRMRMYAKENNFPNLVLRHSKMQNLSDLLKKRQQSSVDQLDSLEKISTKAKDNRTANQSEEISKSQIFLKNSLINKIVQIEFTFIKEHPNSLIAPYLLPSHFSSNPSDSLYRIYFQWPEKIRNSIYGKNIYNELRKKDLSTIHQIASDFRAESLTGEIIQLSNFINKKVVILEFWASWCVPCRQSFPFLKGILSDSNFKDVIIIAVSTDTNINLWKKAINLDATQSFIHILAPPESSTSKDSVNNIISKYEIPAIPMQYIISKNGRIVKKIVGKSKENEIELLELLKNLKDAH